MTDQPTPAQAEERERLLAQIESCVTDPARLGELRQEVDGSPYLEPDDRAGLLGRIDQYRLDAERWRQEGLPEDEQDPDAVVGPQFDA